MKAKELAIAILVCLAEALAFAWFLLVRLGFLLAICWLVYMLGTLGGEARDRVGGQW